MKGGPQLDHPPPTHTHTHQKLDPPSYAYPWQPGAASVWEIPRKLLDFVW